MRKGHSFNNAWGGQTFLFQDDQSRQQQHKCNGKCDPIIIYRKSQINFWLCCVVGVISFFAGAWAMVNI